MMPWKAFELLFFAIFGQTDTASLQVHKPDVKERCPVITAVPLLTTTALVPVGSLKQVTTNLTTTTTAIPEFELGQPEWTEKMFVVAFGIYQIVAVIVLINLLIAMMSDTYQRIQVCNPAPSRRRHITLAFHLFSNSTFFLVQCLLPSCHFHFLSLSRIIFSLLCLSFFLSSFCFRPSVISLSLIVKWMTPSLLPKWSWI